DQDFTRWVEVREHVLVENVLIVDRRDLGGKIGPRCGLAELVDIQTIARKKLLSLRSRNLARQLRQRAVKNQIFEPEQCCEMAIVAAKSTRIVAQGEILGILTGADGAFVIVDAQRIIAERIFEF